MRFRDITSQYPGKCAKCGLPYLKGEQVYFDPTAARGRKVMHISCPEVHDDINREAMNMRQQLDALSKDQLIEVHRLVHGRVGDSGRTSKEQYVQMLEGHAAASADNQIAVGNAIARVMTGVTVQSAIVQSAPIAAPVAAPTEAAAQLLGIIQSLSKTGVDEQVVRKIAEEVTDAKLQSVASVIAELVDKAAKTARRVEVVDHAGEVQDMGIQHRQFPVLLKACAARDRGKRLNVWITGPAGSGKTTAAENVAKALGYKFAFNGAIDTEYKLLGFTDARGQVVSRPFRDIWSNGGLYLFDECDGSMPSATLALNAALSNGTCDFPDGMIPRHPDCIIVAAANTWGVGATSAYVGRNRLDAAFLDRFVQIPWEVDEELETATAPDSTWCKYVQKVRAKVAARKLQHVMVTPRATYYGAALLAAGIDREAVISMTVRRAMTDEQWEQVK